MGAMKRFVEDVLELRKLDMAPEKILAQLGVEVNEDSINFLNQIYNFEDSIDEIEQEYQTE